MKNMILSLLGVLLVVTPANAFISSGSNLDMFGYPKCNCHKPFKPYDTSDSYAVNSYNNDMDAYISCVKKYVEYAKNDIDEITESANNAIKEANNSY